MLTIQPETLKFARIAKALGLEDRKPEELFRAIADAQQGPACAMFEAALRQKAAGVLSDFMNIPHGVEYGTRAASLQGYLNGLENALAIWQNLATWAKQDQQSINKPKEGSP